jgi:TatA/E family protein of Tat protein translocase
MLSVPHLVILFVIALLVFGPEKLPELARMLGKAMAEFRRVTGDVRRVVEDEMRDMELKTREADLRKREADLAAEREKSIMPPTGSATTPAEIISGSTLPPAPIEESAEEEEQRRFRASVEGTVPTERPNNVAADTSPVTPAGGDAPQNPESDEKSDVDAYPS